MVQSAVFRHQELGAEGVPGSNAAWDSGGHAAAGVHGHALVLGLRLREIGNTLPSRKAPVLRDDLQCPVSVHAGDLQGSGDVRI